MSHESLSPIAFEYVLRCSADHAFATYMGRIGKWWDPRYTANPETLETVTIEPRAGGRVYARHGDLGEHDWGEVTVWEPGRRLVHTFSLAQDRSIPLKSPSISSPLRVGAAWCGSLTGAGRRQTPQRSTDSPRSRTLLDM
jgi:hypothetical protein